MNCAKAQEMFSSYLENEMQPQLRAAFEQHLANCPRCEMDYDQFNATMMLLDEAQQVEVPSNFHACVMARVEEARRAVPRPVKWWNLDWGSIFNARVPARAVAMGFAAVLVMAFLVQLTPINTTVAHFIPWQRSTGEPVGDTGMTAQKGPAPWHPSAQDEVSYSLPGAGLTVSLTVDSTNDHGCAYYLDFHSRSEEPVTFDVKLLSSGVSKQVRRSGTIYSGTVTADRDGVVPIIVTRSSQDRSSTAAKVSWSYNGRSYNEYIIVPSEYDPLAADRNVKTTVTEGSALSVLRQMSADYGIVVIASGNLNKSIPAMKSESQVPVEALTKVSDAAGLHSEQLNKTIYAVRDR